MTEPKEKKECERRRDRREIVRGREEKEERRRQRGRERMETVSVHYSLSGL